MPTIRITIKDGAARRADDTRIICGNSDYILHIVPVDTGWAPPYTAEITLTSTEGEVSLVSVTSESDANDIALPAFVGAYIARVHISAGAKKTCAPAVIFCRRGATDHSGEAATRRLDCYNIAMEAVNQALSGKSTAEQLERLAYIGEHLPAAFPGGAYRLATTRPDRVTQVSGTLKLDAETTEITPDSIVADSVALAWNAMASDFLLPGGVPSAELRLTLRTDTAPEDLYGAEIALTYSIQRRDTFWCDIPLGVFSVAEAKADTQTGVPITAYDAMSKIERIPRADLSFTAGTAYTPQEIITTIAAAAGVAYTGDVSDWPSGSIGYFVKDADISIVTARDLLSYTVMTINSIAYIDRFGELRIRKIEKADPVTALPTSQRTATRSSRLPYRLFELDTVIEMHGSDGSAIVHEYDSQTLWSNGVSAQLPENPLWAVIDGTYATVEQRLNIITRSLDPVVFRPGETTILGDPSLDPLDWVSIGGTAIPLTASDWRYRGAHALTACGADAVAGIARSQAEKAALAERQAQAAGADNLLRTANLMSIQSSGHAAMALHDHEWLAHFTHGELAGKEIT